MRFPVRLVLRPAPRTIPTTGPAGRVLEVSDDIVALPSGGRTTVTSIDTPDGPALRATAGQSITVLLADEIDAGRGEVLAHPAQAPQVVTELDADLCWLAEAPLRAGARVLVKHGTRHRPGDRHSLDRPSGPAHHAARRAGVGPGTQRDRRRPHPPSRPLAVDRYGANRHTGSFLVIDPANGNTLAAGLVSPS